MRPRSLQDGTHLGGGVMTQGQYDIFIEPCFSFYFFSHHQLIAMWAETLLETSFIPQQNNIQSFLQEYGLELTPDGEFIRWTVSNARHPRNWHILRKIYDSSLIIFLDLFT